MTLSICLLDLVGTGCANTKETHESTEKGNSEICSEIKGYISDSKDTTERETKTGETESELISEISEVTQMQKEEIRVYICFDENKMQTLSLEEQVELLKQSLDADATFEVRRMDTEGYAIVAKTTSDLLPLLEKASNVITVTVDVPAEKTGNSSKQLETR